MLEPSSPHTMFYSTVITPVNNGAMNASCISRAVFPLQTLNAAACSFKHSAIFSCPSPDSESLPFFCFPGNNSFESSAVNYLVSGLSAVQQGGCYAWTVWIKNQGVWFGSWLGTFSFASAESLHYAPVCRRAAIRIKMLHFSMQTMRAALEKATQRFMNKTWLRQVIPDSWEWQLTLIYMTAAFNV